jgi:hypothetical protein
MRLVTAGTLIYLGATQQIVGPPAAGAWASSENARSTLSQRTGGLKGSPFRNEWSAERLHAIPEGRPFIIRAVDPYLWIERRRVIEIQLKAVSFSGQLHFSISTFYFGAMESFQTSEASLKELRYSHRMCLK